MGELEKFVRCMIKCEITKIPLKIYQPHLIIKTTQVLNKDVKSLMIFNTPDTPHKSIVRNQETYIKHYTICRRDIGVA